MRVSRNTVPAAQVQYLADYLVCISHQHPGYWRRTGAAGRCSGEKDPLEVRCRGLGVAGNSTAGAGWQRHPAILAGPPPAHNLAGRRDIRIPDLTPRENLAMGQAGLTRRHVSGCHAGTGGSVRLPPQPVGLPTTPSEAGATAVEVLNSGTSGSPAANRAH